MLVDRDWLDTYELEKYDNPTYIADLVSYVQEQIDDPSESRSNLDAESLRLLQGHEHFWLSELEELLPSVQAMGFHLSLKRTVEHSWMRTWSTPEAYETGFLWDHMAILTLPRGPEETVDSYYANARQGVYILAIIGWGAGYERPHVTCYISRVKEKGAVYTQAILADFLQHRVRLHSTKDVSFWSDGGRHFRSNVAIASTGAQHNQNTAIPNRI